MLPVLVMSALLAQDAPAMSASPAATPVAVPAASSSAAAPPGAAHTARPSAARPGMIRIDAYHETPRDSTNSHIWSAFDARQTEAGPMAGTWIVSTEDGRKLVSFELRADTSSRKLEGAWRSLVSDVGLTGAGFVSDVYLDGPALEINYGTSRTRTPNVLELRKTTDGDWRGVLLDPAGHRTEVVMTHVVHAG